MSGGSDNGSLQIGTTTHIAGLEALVLRSREMYNTVEEYREYLEGLCYEHLLGHERLEQMAEEAIEARVDAIRSELEDMDYEELLCPNCLEELAEQEIERRIEEFEASQE